MKIFLLSLLAVVSIEAGESTWHAFDRRLIEDAEEVELVVAKALADPEPLMLDGDFFWTQNNVHAAVQHDPESGEFFGWRFALEPVDGASDGRVVYPIRSDDGKAWRTVGDGYPMMGAIVRDDRDPESKRRFKTVFQGWAELDEEGRLLRTMDKIQWAQEGGKENEKLERGIFSAVSPDGVNWTDHLVIAIEEIPEGQRWWRPGQPGWAGGDNFPCLLWAPTLEKWVCYFRTNLDRVPNMRRERAVGWSASADFENWEPHRLALHADTNRLHALGFGKQDYYQHQVWPVGDAYLGVLSVFYWREDRVHLELAWSPDTVHWERIQPGRDLVPHGPLGVEGNGCRYAAMRPLKVGDETWIYFGADDGRHNADKDRSGGLWLARFRRGRVAGLRTQGEGVVHTKPVTLSGRPIEVDAEGEVSVKALEDGSRLEIRMRNATLFSISY